jgi:hypothetical protein
MMKTPASPEFQGPTKHAAVAEKQILETRSQVTHRSSAMEMSAATIHEWLWMQKHDL